MPVTLLNPALIPTPPKEKPRAFFDTECYVNYWLLRFQVENGPCLTWELFDGQTLSLNAITTIDWYFQNFEVVSFNGRTYDVPMIGAALRGYNPAQLKAISDRIIIEELKPWELGISDWAPLDHIDIMEVLPGKESQKTYAGIIHSAEMRDLPYDPDDVLTPEQIAALREYCGHDLLVLGELFHAADELIDLRRRMTKEYGVDVRSKSDAQVAEAVIKFRYEQLTNQRVWKSQIDWNLRFRYETPSFISFQTPQLQEALGAVQRSIFGFNAASKIDLPEELQSLQIKIGSSVYTMGIGGLHSTEKSRAWVSNATHQLRDADVASYYPTLIINSGKFPKALGPLFIQIFTEIKDKRLAAKKLQKELEKNGFKGTVEWKQARADNESGKIMINGTFGKTGSPFSILFAPEMLIQTTITGQLSILMLIEALELAGISVVSSNTDGIVMYCPRHLSAVADAIVKDWERRTGLEMETSDMKALYSRDVNAYFAIKADGEVKRKGPYGKSGLLEKKRPTAEICGDAVAKFLTDGIPTIYTLATCHDIKKFVTVRMVGGGAIKWWGECAQKETKVAEMKPRLIEHGWVEEKRGKWSKCGFTFNSRRAYESTFPPQRPEYVGKSIRFYYSTNAPGHIKARGSGDTVSLTYGAKPCMLMPTAFPDDIDLHWYEEKCIEILKDIGALVA